MDREISGATGMIAAAGRHWGWVLGYGILTLITAILVLAWPDATLVVIAVLFGAQLVVTGIFRFVAALAADEESGGTRVLYALLGVLSFIVGLYALRHILVTIVVLGLMFGIFWIVNGTVEVFSAMSYDGMRGRGWIIVMGLLSIVAGIVVLVYPGLSLVALTFVLGVWLLIFGAMELVLAFSIRSAGRHVVTGAPGPSVA